jgi:putative membrane protein
MAHKVSHLFTPKDLQDIRLAVQAAEKKTSGEIVPYLVDASDEYEEAEWRFGALLAVLVLGTSAAFHQFSDVWLPLDVAILVLLTGGAFLLGLGLVRAIPSLKRLFAGGALISKRVAARAAQAFLSEEVFKTRERTGILIFVSVLEHRVLVLGDSGINAKVREGQWSDVVGIVTRAIAHGTPAAGLIEAIGSAGELLLASGVERRPDDTDELSDNLRIQER